MRVRRVRDNKSHRTSSVAAEWKVVVVVMVGGERERDEKEGNGQQRDSAVNSMLKGEREKEWECRTRSSKRTSQD